jgi:hypothetical protein
MTRPESTLERTVRRFLVIAMAMRTAQGRRVAMEIAARAER